MAKRVNKPAVALLTIGLMIVLTVVGVLLVKSLPTTNVTPIVKSAEQSFAKKDYRDAVGLYKTAFDRSHDPKWLVEAGKVAREWGEAGVAFSMWQTAIIKDASFTEARQQYVALWIELLELSDWHAPGDMASRVSEYADALLRAQPDDFNGRFARGISYLALRKDKPELEALGLQDLQKALTMQPDDERVLTVLGQYYMDPAVKKPAEAQKLYENLVQQQKENPAGYLMLGRLLMGQAVMDPAKMDPAKVDQAIPLLTKATELSKGSVKTLVALAQAYQLKKDSAKAQELLSNAMQVEPEGFDAYWQQSVLLMGENKPEGSLKIAKQWLEKKPVYTGFKANLYRSQRVRMLQQAVTASIMLAAPSKDGDKPNEDLLKQAEGYVADIEKDMGKDGPMTLMERADIHRLRGQSIAAIKLLERADTATSSMSPDVKIRLAELYRLDGNLGAAQKALTALSQLAPAYWRGYYLQAAIASQLGNRNEALSFLDRGLSLEPQNKEMLQMKAAVLRAVGSHDAEVKQIEKTVDSGGGTSVTDKLQLAQRKLLEERPEEAEVIYREVLADEPANLTALRTVLQLLIQAGKSDEARQLFDKAKAAGGDNARIRDLQFLFVANLSPEQQEQKILELVQAEPDPVVRGTQLYVFYVSRQKYDEAQKAVDALEAARPGNDRAVRMQFSLALARKDWSRAQKYADIAGQGDMDGAEGGFLRAQVAMRQGDWPKAQTELERALTRYPSHPDGWVWLSEALLHLKQFDKAKDVLLNKALAINPAKGQAYKDLAILAEQQGDEDGYRANLEKAIQYLSNDAWVVERGTYLREQQDPDRAIEIRRKMLDADPKDRENTIRLALLLEKKEQFKEAGDLFARALSLDSKDARIVSLAAGYWQRRGDGARAEKILAEYEQAAQGEDKARANVLLAGLHRQLGELDKAEQAFNVAAKLSSQPQIRMQLAEFYRNAGRIQDASDAYRRGIEMAGKDEKTQTLARQQLVELLLQSQKLTDASTEIEAFHKALPNDPVYLLMRGTLLMMQGQTDPAVAALSDFLQKDRNNAIGLFHRGSLYLAMNRLPQAIEDLQAAKLAQPGAFGFEHRIALARAFEANKQADRAASELKDVLQSYPIQSNPQSQSVAKALAGLYQRMGRPQDFEALAETCIAQAPKDWSWPIALGGFAESSGNLAKAIKAYKTAVQASENNPEVIDNLLRAQVAAKQYDQVIEYVEKQIPEQSRVGPAKARLAEAWFHKGQQDKARALYKEALQEVSQSYPLSTMVLRNISGTLHSEGAMAMLRARLADKPDDASAKYLLMIMLIEKGQVDEALALNDQLAAAAKADDEKKVILLARGTLLYQAGKYEQAAKAYEQLLTLAPNDTDSLNNLAYILAENLNRPAEALRYATRAVELAPRNVDLLDTLGWVQYLAGDTDGALGTLVSALQLSPNHIPGRYHVGMVYKKKADAGQAKREFEHAQDLIKGNPGDGVARMFEERVRKALLELAGGNVAGK